MVVLGRKRRRLAIGAVCLSVALAVVIGQSAAIAAKTASGRKVTLTYGLWATSFEPSFEAAAKKFHQKNPNITVKFVYTPFPDYFTKLNTEISSKSAPDLFWLENVQYPLYAHNHALANLANYGVSVKKLAAGGIPSHLLTPYESKGALYAVPHQTITCGLYYNKALFAAAGVAVPTDKWTWADVTAAAAKLTNKSTGVYGLVSPEWDQCNYFQTMEQAGADIVSPNGKTSDFGSAAGIAGLNFWVNLVKDGSSPSLSALTDTPSDSWFTSGKSAMIYSGPWNAPTYTQSSVGPNVRVVELPKGRTKVSGGYVTVTTVVSASSRHAADAAKFAAFLGTAQGAKLLSANGTIMPANVHANATWEKSIPGVGLQNFLAQLPTDKLLPGDSYDVWEPQDTNILAPAWEGTGSVASVAKQMQSVIDSALYNAA